MTWEILANVPDNGLYDIHDGENVVAMNVGARYVNLLATAPELHEALRAFADVCENVDDVSYSRVSDARDLLAKADRTEKASKWLSRARSAAQEER